MSLTFATVSSFNRKPNKMKSILKNIPDHIKQPTKQFLKFPLMLMTRIDLLTKGNQPLLNTWADRGSTIHRTYLDQFLQQVCVDIKGHCLEFEEDRYTSIWGGNKVTKLDILNKETDNPNSTIIADLTQPNDIPSDTFDCIICTYVLHIIPELDRFVADLHRILKPGGVLLIAVPGITIHFCQYEELWRFTRQGLHLILSKVFPSENITTQSYGNSLTATGELRGMVAFDFTAAQLNYQDPRYALVVCARAVK